MNNKISSENYLFLKGFIFSVNLLPNQGTVYVAITSLIDRNIVPTQSIIDALDCLDCNWSDYIRQICESSRDHLIKSRIASMLINLPPEIRSEAYYGEEKDFTPLIDDLYDLIKEAKKK